MGPSDSKVSHSSFREIVPSLFEDLPPTLSIERLKVATRIMKLGLFRKTGHIMPSLQEDRSQSTVEASCGKTMTLSPSHDSPSCMIDPEILRLSFFQGMSPYPRSQQATKDQRQIVGDTRCKINGSVLHDDGTETETCTSYDDMDEEGSTTPGLLSGGIPYTVTNRLVQGWVHKKGSGQDWVGSKAWKPRWAVLSVSECVVISTSRFYFSHVGFPI